MRTKTLWSLGVCTLCAALVHAQAPGSRSFGPQDGKQSVNKLAPRDGVRAITEKPEPRALLSVPGAATISEEKGAKYAAGALDVRNLDNVLRESAQTRILASFRPAPGEKANALPESAQSRNLTEPSAHRFLPDDRPSKPRFFPTPAERR
jgi:hypothetical protein